MNTNTNTNTWFLVVYVVSTYKSLTTDHECLQQVLNRLGIIQILYFIFTTNEVYKRIVQYKHCTSRYTKKSIILLIIFEIKRVTVLIKSSTYTSE